MRKLEEELKEIMERELEAYRTVLEHARKKTEILKESKVTELELLTLEERELVGALEEISAERENSVRGLADSLGVNERLDLSAMSEHFTDDGKAEFKALKDEFNGVIEEIRRVNNLNETLIKDSLDYIDFSLNLMTSAKIEGNYGNRAEEIEQSGTNKKNLFDFKA